MICSLENFSTYMKVVDLWIVILLALDSHFSELVWIYCE